MKNVRRIVTILLTMAMMMSFVTSVMAISFSDLDASHWAYEYITTLADKGVINGYTDGTYRPSGNITRAEFLKLITVAAIGEEEANNVYVPDDYYMKDKWYGKYVYWAEENELLINYFGGSAWDYEINRIEMARLLYTYSNYLGLFDRSGDDSVLSSSADSPEYNDVERLASGDIAFLDLVSRLGLITGYEDGSFKPYKFMTRAEVATVIYRFENLK